MTSMEKTAVFATENMRSTTSKFQDSRQISQSARSNTPKTWGPQYGIVFGSSQTPGGYRGLGTAAAEDILRNHQLHSEAEVNYVLADAVKLESQSTVAAMAGKTTVEAPVILEAKVAHTAKPIAAAEPEPEDPEQNELPETSTSYKMPEELFRAAKNAEPGSPGSFWSHTLYRSPEEPGVKSKKPTVHYCRSKLTTERVLKAYFMNQKVIGFDIEWKSEQRFKSKGPRQNVSLVQIACEDRIALFHLALYPKGEKIDDLVSPLLKKILEDPEVTKVGVAIKGDCTRVSKHLDIKPQGIFELSHLNKLVKFSKTKDFGKINKTLVSLAKQVQEHLHLPMSKATEVRSSDWSRTLDLSQILYAAADSYAGFQLFHTMELKRKALDPMPPCPYHAELNKPIRFAEGIEIPVDNEAEEIEDEEVEAPAPTKRKYTRRSAKELALESESIKLEDAEPVGVDLDADYVSSSNPSPSSDTSSLHSTDSPAPITSPITTSSTISLLETATAQTLLHFTSANRHNPTFQRPSPHTLQKARSYFLWYANPHLSFLRLGGILKNPNALPVRIVTNNILEAIQELGLEPGNERLRGLLKAWRVSAGMQFGPVGQGKFGRLERKSGLKEERDLDEEV